MTKRTKKPPKWTDAESYFHRAKEIHQERLMMVYLFVKNVVLPTTSTPVRDHMYGREVANMIFDLPSIYSGQASTLALLQKRIFKVDWCEEHEWPRQLAGEFLVRTFRKKGDVDLPQLREFLFGFMHVNRTTPVENEALKAYYRETQALEDPQQAYKAVGIELLSWPPHSPISKLENRHPHLKSTVMNGQIILTGNSVVEAPLSVS